MRFTTWALASCLTLGLTGWASDAMAGKGKPAPPPPPPPPAPIEPPARAWHAFAGNGGITSSASRLYLIGGAGSDGQALGDFWYYRRDTATWTVAPAGSSKPGKRQWVGFSCGAGQCVTSNGNNGVGLLKETWTYTEATGNWSQVNCKRVLCPSARHMATMAYAEGLGHLLFGGRSGSGSLGDSYVFSGGKWISMTPTTRPGTRDRAAATYVPGPVNGIVMFGGQRNSATALCDMWAWTGDNWQRITTNAGPCLHTHDMAWDGNRLVVTGGFTDTSDTASHDVWYFTFESATRGSWRPGADTDGCYASAKPGARMAYDIPSGRKVIFGGEQNGPNGLIRYDDLAICD